MKSDETTKVMIEALTVMLSHNSLHHLLEALSRGCMARCREMLNADTPKDDNGNTLRALFDFSERINRLARSAQSHNPDARNEEREMRYDKGYDKVKAKRSYDSDYDE